MRPGAKKNPIKPELAVSSQLTPLLQRINGTRVRLELATKLIYIRMLMKKDVDNISTHVAGVQVYIMFGATVMEPC